MLLVLFLETKLQKSLESMENSILLVGDIGLFENGAYHVGDEAMFLVNYRKYKNLGSHVYAISRSFSHTGYELKEEAIYPKFESIFSLLSFIIQAIIYKYTSYSSKTYYNLFRLINEVNLVHISGGGNLNSTWPEQLYLRIGIIIVSKILKKRVILTGQTIGPKLSSIDKLLLKIALNQSEAITLREPDSYDLVKRLLKEDKQILLAPDDTYANPLFKTAKDIKITAELRDLKNSGYKIIGLSLHFWKSAEYDTRKIKHTISQLKQLTDKIVFLIIPHSILPTNSQSKYSDLHFTKSLFTSEDKLIYLDYEQYFEQEKQGITASDIVLQLTAQVDLMLATRYHGIVFGAINNKPIIYLNYDEYYKVKNTGFLELIKYTSCICLEENTDPNNVKKFIENQLKLTK